MILLTTICNGFRELWGAGFEFLVQAIKKQQLIKIKNIIFFIVVTLSISYVMILILVSFRSVTSFPETTPAYLPFITDDRTLNIDINDPAVFDTDFQPPEF